QGKVTKAKEVVSDKATSVMGSVTERLPGVTGQEPGAEDRLVAAGRAGLSGWRAKMADKVSRPVAERTGLTEAQVEAVIGGLFLLLAALQFFRLMGKVSKAWRTAE